MEGGRLRDRARARSRRRRATACEQVEFRVASHPKQPLGPLARVASGGELSRIALAIQVVTSEVGAVPTLIFDEVDAGIGGAVAATVGRLLQSLGARRQVLCVTHLPQVAAFADAHFRVTKRGDAHVGARRGRARSTRQRASRSSRGCSPAARSPPRRARTRRNSSSSTAGGRPDSDHFAIRRRSIEQAGDDRCPVEKRGGAACHGIAPAKLRRRPAAGAISVRAVMPESRATASSRRRAPRRRGRLLRRGRGLGAPARDAFGPGSGRPSPVSSQWRTRCASPSRVYLPSESSSTITNGRLPIVASMTRHLPASRM